MLYALAAWFRSDVESQRLALHESFNEHIAQRRPRVRLGGPLRNEAGERVGVLILLDADSRRQAQAFLEASPYAKAGLYARVDVAALDLEVGSLG